MHIINVMKLFGLGVSLIVLLLVAGKCDRVRVAQSGDCTVIVQLRQSIQQAIDQAPEGAVVCLSSGTFQEDIQIKKSLTLRGAGRARTVIKGAGQKNPRDPRDMVAKPVVGIESTAEIEVLLEGLTITESKSVCYFDSCSANSGIGVGAMRK